MLLSYLALFGRDSDFLGHPLSPLTVAVAAGLVARQIKSNMFHPTHAPRRMPVLGSLCGLLAICLVAYSPSPEQLQAAYSVFLLGCAAATLGIVRFLPSITPRLPSMWAGQGKSSPDAMTFVAGSVVLRAVAAWCLMLAGDPLVWILFVSVGTLAINFLTNWVILLYLYLQRVNGSDS